MTFVRFGSWLRKNVSTQAKIALGQVGRAPTPPCFAVATLDSTLELSEADLSHLRSPKALTRCPILQARIATRSGFTPTMFITRVRL
jgi:hypothetical protein